MFCSCFVFILVLVPVLAIVLVPVLAIVLVPVLAIVLVPVLVLYKMFFMFFQFMFCPSCFLGIVLVYVFILDFETNLKHFRDKVISG